jgi:hypothetical protein
VNRQIAYLVLPTQNERRLQKNGHMRIQKPIRMKTDRFMQKMGAYEESKANSNGCPIP